MNGSDVENVGGLGITLEIEDKTETQIQAIADRLNTLVQPRKILVSLGSQQTTKPPAQHEAEDRLGRVLSSSLEKFTAALADIKVKIDPESISAIARAIREAMTETSPSPSAYAGTRGNAFTLAAARATGPTGSGRVQEIQQGVFRAEVQWDRTYGSARRASGSGPQRERGRATPAGGGPAGEPTPSRPIGFGPPKPVPPILGAGTVTAHRRSTNVPSPNAARDVPNAPPESPEAEAAVDRTTRDWTKDKHGRWIPKKKRFGGGIPAAWPHAKVHSKGPVYKGEDPQVMERPGGFFPLQEQLLSDRLVAVVEQDKESGRKFLRTTTAAAMETMPTRRRRGRATLRHGAQEVEDLAVLNAGYTGETRRVGVPVPFVRNTITREEERIRWKESREALDPGIRDLVLGEAPGSDPRLIDLETDTRGRSIGTTGWRHPGIRRRSRYSSRNPELAAIEGQIEAAIRAGAPRERIVELRAAREAKIREIKERNRGSSAARLNTEAETRALWESTQTSGYRESGDQQVDRVTVGSRAQNIPPIPRAFRTTPLGRMIRPTLLKAVQDSQRSDEELGQISTSYRITPSDISGVMQRMSKLTPERWDKLTKLRPEMGKLREVFATGTEQQKFDALADVRIPAHAEAMIDLGREYTSAGLGTDVMRMTQGRFGALGGARVERVSRPVRFLETLAQALRGQGMRVDLESLLHGGDKELGAYVNLALEWLQRVPTAATAAGHGAEFMQRTPTPQVGEPLAPQMDRVSSLPSRVTRALKHKGIRPKLARMRGEAGYTRTAAGLMSPQDQRWVAHIRKRIGEGAESGWDERGVLADPRLAELVEMVENYKLGPVEYRPEEYRDTTRFPEVSSQDIMTRLYGESPTRGRYPGQEWRIDYKKWFEQIASGDIHATRPFGWMPRRRRRGEPEYRRGLFAELRAERGGNIPEVANLLIRSVLGEVHELAGGRRKKQDADIVKTRGRLRWTGSSEATQRALRDQARTERETFGGRRTAAYGFGAADPRFFRHLPVEITKGLRETAEQQANIRYATQMQEWEQSAADTPPPAAPHLTVPGYRTGEGQILAWDNLTREQQQRARPAGEMTQLFLRRSPNLILRDFAAGNLPSAEETEARRRALLQTAVAFPRTEEFTRLPVARQRGARYESAVANVALDRILAQEDYARRQATGENRPTRRERRLTNAQFTGRYARSFATQREESWEPRELSLEEEIAAWRAKEEKDLRRNYRENLGARSYSRFQENIDLAGPRAVLNKRRQRLWDIAQRTQGVDWSQYEMEQAPRFGQLRDYVATGRASGISAPARKFIDSLSPVATPRAEPTPAAEPVPTESPSATPPTPPETPRTTAAGGPTPGGPSAGVPGGPGGEFTLGGKPIHVIVDDIKQGKVTITNPAVIRESVEERKAKEAAQRPSVPPWAIGFKGPKQGEPVPVETAVPEFSRGFIGPARPEYQAIKAFDKEHQRNIDAMKAGMADELGQAQRDLQASATKKRQEERQAEQTRREQAAQQKKEEDASIKSALRAPTKEKMVRARMDELMQAAANIRPLDETVPGRSEAMRAAAEASVEPRYQDLVNRAKDIYESTKGLLGEKAPSSARWSVTMSELRRLQETGVIPNQLFATNEEIAPFKTDVMRATGEWAGPAARTGTTPATGREGNVKQRFERGLKQMGIQPPARPPTQGRQAPPGLLGTDEFGETIDPYSQLIANQAQAAAQARELGLRALSTMGIQYIGAKLGPYKKINEAQRNLARISGEAAKKVDTAGEGLTYFREAAMPKYFEAKTRAEAPGASAEDIRTFRVVRQEYIELAKATRAQRMEAKEAVAAQAEASKGIVTAGDAAQHFAASFVGGIAGGVIGGMAGMVIQPLMQAIGTGIEKIGGPILDQALGYSMTQQRVVSELSQGTTAAGGMAGVAFAQKYQFAPTGVTSRIGTLAQDQAEVVAASKQIEEIRDLYRATSNMGTGPGGTPTALFTTKGPLGTPLMADYKSIAELFSSNMVASKNTNTGQYAPGLAGARQDAAKSAPWVDVINEMLGGAAGKYEFRQGSDQERAASKRAMVDMGLGPLASAGFVAIDKATGQIADSAEELADVLMSAAKEFSRVDPGQYLKTLQPQMRTQIAQMTWQRDWQINEVNPLQRALQLAQSPLMPAGTGVMPGAGAELWNSTAGINRPMQWWGQPMGYNPALAASNPATGGMNAAGFKMPAAATATFNEYKSTIDSLQADIRNATTTIESQLRKWGVPEDTISSVTRYSAIIAGAQAKIAGIQSGRSESKYQHSLYMANRALSDARQLSGQIGQTANSNVGFYERQLLLINRQNQALSLQLQRRQILTQLALARFQVPGETGEERYARRMEAEISAGIQQKQLGLAQQAFGTEIKLVDEQNLRAVQDAAYALKELKADYFANKEIAMLEQVISNAQRAMQSVLMDVEAWTGFRNNYESMMASIASDLVGKTGENMTKMLAEVRKAVYNDSLLMQILGVSASGASSSGTPTYTHEDSRPPGPTGGNPGYTVKPTVSQRTTIDQRQVNIQQGAVSIVVETKTLDEEQVADLQRQVVGALNRAAQLIGLRPVAT